MTSDPIFIVGAPRSGTSITRLLVNGHSNVAVPGETSFFPAIFDRCDDWQVRWHDAVGAFMHQCERAFEPRIDLDSVQTELLAADADPGRLLSLPLQRWAAAQGKGRWGEKTPYHIFFADVIWGLFPGAKIIEMIRDPRSVVASMNRFRWTSDDAILNARLWRDVQTKGRAVLLEHAPADGLLTIRYESLVADPEHTARTICSFIGEDFESTMLATHESARAFVPDPQSPKIVEPISAGRADWTTELTERQVAQVEAVCRPVMEELGYQPVTRNTPLAVRAEASMKNLYVALKQRQHHDLRYHPVQYRPLERLRRSR